MTGAGQLRPASTEQVPRGGGVFTGGDTGPDDGRGAMSVAAATIGA
ncbi:hypothetical protein ABZ707_30465 [Streptomyces sp. NPDC006923]